MCPMPDQSACHILLGHGHWLRDCPVIRARPVRHNSEILMKPLQRSFFPPGIVSYKDTLSTGIADHKEGTWIKMN